MIRWGKRLFYLVLVLLIVAVGSIYLVPAIMGFNLAVVYSGSMEPAMPVGALALMQPIDPFEIEIGDIIAFNPVRDPDTIVSHRVVDILVGSKSLEFRTKGDANEDPDVYNVPAANVLARINLNLPYLGYALTRIGKYTRSRLGLVLLVCLPTLSLIIIAIRDMSVIFSPRRKRLARLKERKKLRNRRKSHYSSYAWIMNFI